MAGKLATRTQAERRAATRAQLLSAAEQLTAERGFSEASLAEIADAAGVSKGALYHHFESKDELLQALLDERFQERIHAAVRLGMGSAAEATEQLVEEIPFDRRWNLLFLEFVVHAARDPELRRHLLGRLERLRENSTQAIAAFLEREGIKSDLSAADLALIVAALGNGLAIEALISTRRKTDPLYAAALGLLLKGLHSDRQRGDG
jgi:AcrR family transcriptional regulator